LSIYWLQVGEAVQVRNLEHMKRVAGVLVDLYLIQQYYQLA
jgi:hypothetical protein